MFLLVLVERESAVGVVARLYLHSDLVAGSHCLAVGLVVLAEVRDRFA